MSEQELIKEIQELSRILKERYGRTTEDILSHISSDDDTVPATVFSTDMSPLQAIVTYMKDHGKDFSAIASNLHRSYRAVWGAYQHQGIKVASTSYTIPLDLFDDKKSILECVVTHLKERYDMKFAEIAHLLHKDPRTIWTVWNRAKKKNARTR